MPNGITNKSINKQVMKTTFKSISLLIGLAFLLGSCGKYDDGPGLSLKSKKNRLQQEWQLEELEVNGTDFTSDINIWEIEFKKGGDYDLIFQEVGFDAGPDAGEWDFSNSKEEIEMKSDDGERLDLDIKRLTSKELWFETTVEYSDGTSARWDCKFEAK